MTSKKHESNTRVEGKNPCAKFPGEGSEKKEQVSEREGDRGRKREREWERKNYICYREHLKNLADRKRTLTFSFLWSTSPHSHSQTLLPHPPPIHTFPPPLLCHCLQRFHVFEQRSFWDYFCATFRACEAKARSWSQSWVWLFDSFVE